MDDVKAVHGKNRIAGDVGVGVWVPVDLKGGRIPGVDIGAEASRLDADIPDAIFGIGDCDRSGGCADCSCAGNPVGSDQGHHNDNQGGDCKRDPSWVH